MTREIGYGVSDVCPLAFEKVIYLRVRLHIDGIAEYGADSGRSPYTAAQVLDIAGLEMDKDIAQ